MQVRSTDALKRGESKHVDRHKLLMLLRNSYKITTAHCHGFLFIEPMSSPESICAALFGWMFPL